MIQRDPAAAHALIYVHPDVVSSGSPVMVGPGDSLVLLFDGEPRDFKTEGTHHAYSPSYATVRAVFVRTAPTPLRAGGAVNVRGPSGASERIKFAAEIALQVADPRALCSAIGDADPAAAPARLQSLLTKKVSMAIDAEVARACAGKGQAAAADPATAQRVSGAVQQALQQAGVGVGGVQVLSAAVRLITEGGAGAGAAQAGAIIPIGARVFGYWTDGRWYPAVVRAHRDGHYEVDWEGNPHTAWLPASHVRPA